MNENPGTEGVSLEGDGYVVSSISCFKIPSVTDPRF